MVMKRSESRRDKADHAAKEGNANKIDLTREVWQVKSIKDSIEGNEQGRAFSGPAPCSLLS
jgi:hypothetical protein